MKQEAMATKTAIDIDRAVESMVTGVTMVPRVDDTAVTRGRGGSCPAEAAVEVTVVMRGM